MWDVVPHVPLPGRAAGGSRQRSWPLHPSRRRPEAGGVPPAPRRVPGAAPSAAKVAYNTMGEGIWEQTGLGEKSAFFLLTGSLGFQPSLGTAAGEGWRAPGSGATSPPGRGEPAGTAQTRHFSISVHAGIGAATGAYWCGRAAGRHSTGMCWEALPGSNGCSPSCPGDVAPSSHGDSRGGHQAPLAPLALQPGARHHRDPAGRARPVPPAAGGIKASIHGRAGPASVISCSPGAASVTPARC